MRRCLFFYSILFFLCGFLAACDKLAFSKPKKAQETFPKLSVKGKVIARVNNLAITLEDLNTEIEAYNAAVADKPEAKIITPEQKIDYLKKELVPRSLFYQEALARGLEKKEEVARALERNRESLLAMQLLRQEAVNLQVSPQEIEDYYQTFKEELKEPEERHLAEIMVPTEEEAKEILILLLQGQDFATLAKERSKVFSAKKGGDLGYLSRGRKFAQFDNIAFSDSLEVGKVSTIFKGPDGYYILKLEAKRGGQQKLLSEIWGQLKEELTFLKQQRMIEELSAKLSEKAKIEIYEGEIK